MTSLADVASCSEGHQDAKSLQVNDTSPGGGEREASNAGHDASLEGSSEGGDGSVQVRGPEGGYPGEAVRGAPANDPRESPEIEVEEEAGDGASSEEQDFLSADGGDCFFSDLDVDEAAVDNVDDDALESGIGDFERDLDLSTGGHYQADPDPDPDPDQNLEQEQGQGQGQHEEDGSFCCHAVKSGPSTEPTEVIFRNKTDRGVDCLWIDYRGREVSYGTLAPGWQHLVYTFVRHPWIFRDEHTREPLCIGRKLIVFPEDKYRSRMDIERPSVLEWSSLNHWRFPGSFQEVIRETLLWHHRARGGNYQDLVLFILAKSAPEMLDVEESWVEQQQLLAYGGN